MRLKNPDPARPLDTLPLCAIDAERLRRMLAEKPMRTGTHDTLKRTLALVERELQRRGEAP